MYVLLVLLAATVMSAVPYNLLALALMVAMLFNMIRPVSPGLSVAINAATFCLAPLALAPLLNNLAQLTSIAAAVISVIIISPAIYLLDRSLRQAASHAPIIVNGKSGRHITHTGVSLLTSTLVVMLLSPVVDKPVLLFTGIAFALYLLGILAGILLTIPRLPLTTSPVRKRIIAGTTGSISVRLSMARIRASSSRMLKGLVM